MEYTLQRGGEAGAISVVRTSTRAAQRTAQDWQREGAQTIVILDRDGSPVGFGELAERIKRGF